MLDSHKAKRVRTTIYIKEEVKKKGEKVAQERNRSLSNLVEDLIDQAAKEEAKKSN